MLSTFERAIASCKFVLPILFAAMGAADLHAQTRDQLIERFREQCRAKFAHLRGPGQQEVMKAHVRPCVQGNMRAFIQGELGATMKRLESLIDAGKLKETEAGANAGIARARQLMSEDRPPWAGGYAILGRSLLFQGAFRRPSRRLARRSPSSVSRVRRARPPDRRSYSAPL